MKRQEGIKDHLVAKVRRKLPTWATSRPILPAKGKGRKRMARPTQKELLLEWED